MNKSTTPINLLPQVSDQLGWMAWESGLTPAELIASLVEKEDQLRHLRYSGRGQFVRLQCGRKSCCEMRRE